MLRQHLTLAVPFDMSGFGALFFRRCVATGHIYARAPEEYLKRYWSELALKRGLPPQPVPESGSRGSWNWEPRFLLKEGDHQRLLGYEKSCRKGGRPLKYIVNLAQNATFMNHFSELVPTVLTRTSFLWDMMHSRPFIPLELLEVMGIPVFSPEAKAKDRSAVETLGLSGKLSSDELRRLSGNAMHLAAVGSVLAFALSMLQQEPASSRAGPAAPKLGPSEGQNQQTTVENYQRDMHTAQEAQESGLGARPGARRMKRSSPGSSGEPCGPPGGAAQPDWHMSRHMAHDERTPSCAVLPAAVQ